MNQASQDVRKVWEEQEKSRKEQQEEQSNCFSSLTEMVWTNISLIGAILQYFIQINKPSNSITYEVVYLFQWSLTG